MPATTQSNTATDPLLAYIEGDTVWDGIINLHFLDPNDGTDVSLFAGEMSNLGYATNTQGLPATWQSQILDAFARWSDVANISIQTTNLSSANYLVGDVSPANSSKNE